MMGVENYQRQMEKQVIEIAPLAYMRGRTLDDSFIILDEAQNATPEQMKMFLTRLGFNSKAVITGDLTQTDLPYGQKSGLAIATHILSDIEAHLAPMGVRVNAIAPGFFITDQNRFLMMEKDGKTPTARGNKVLAKTPMRKFGQPSDLHGAARFLISDDASFVTGVTLPVDGGFVCYSGV